MRNPDGLTATCPTCKESKALSEFGSTACNCHGCCADLQRERRARVKKEGIHKIKCEKCGQEVGFDAWDQRGKKFCSRECQMLSRRTGNEVIQDQITKECPACLRTFDIETFLYKKIPSIVQDLCRECRTVDDRVRRKFGISAVDYFRMLRSQDYCCAICGRHEDDQLRRLAVDHKHATGQVRGLLCDNCNPALGMLQDSVDVLRAAIEYLEGWEAVAELERQSSDQSRERMMT